ncbi:hypothetical protein FACS18947_2640 [Bacteroidia bacterium]|nr:hypothetical protein FACS18947_2640 [Bacteroidia bacterium]
MKKRLEQLITEKFEYTVPTIILSEKEIVAKAKENEFIRGEFFFCAEDNSRIKGMIFTNSRRIVLSKDRFSGNTIHISYGFDTRGLQAGDRFSGEIVIASDLGEYRIPVGLTVEREPVKTSKGEIRDLSQFTALVEADYHEAFRLFTKPAFRTLLKGESDRIEALYQGMSHNPVTYQHMEEFLIGAGKKEPVRITLDKTRKELLHLENSMKDSIYLYKSTWGYVRMEVEVEGDFLEVEKKVITAEDFIGSVYGLEYVISRDKLGKGKRTGRIFIRSVYGTQTFEVCVSAHRDLQITPRGFENQTQLELIKNTLTFLVGQMDYLTWKDKMFVSLEELKAVGCFTILHQLIEAYVHFAGNNAAQAMELLSLLKDRTFTSQEAQEEGFYLYLAKKMETLLPDVKDVGARLSKLYQKNSESTLLLLLALRMSPEFSQSPVKKLALLEHRFEAGYTSPFLYLEAAMIIQKEENYLKRLSPFMIQVLSFAARYGMLNAELSMRISYMSEHEKRFKSSIYRI